MAELPLEKVRCNPAGSVSTALDVDIDRGTRRCGMCARLVEGSKLHGVCPFCWHRFGWFQLLTEASAIGASPPSEKALGNYITRYKKRQAQYRGTAFTDGPDDM